MQAVVNTVDFQDLGASVQIGQGDQDLASANVAITLELSVVAETGIEIARGAKAHAIHRLTTSYHGPVEPGRPIVLLAAEGSGGPEPRMFVWRLVLGDAPERIGSEPEAR